MAVRGRKNTLEAVRSYLTYRSLGGFEEYDGWTLEEENAVLRSRVSAELARSDFPVEDESVDFAAQSILKYEPELREKPENLRLNDPSSRKSGFLSMTFADEESGGRFGIAFGKPNSFGMRYSPFDLDQIFGNKISDEQDSISIDMELANLITRLDRFKDEGFLWSDVDKHLEFYDPFLQYFEKRIRYASKAGADVPKELLLARTGGLDFYSVDFKRRGGHVLHGFNFGGNLGKEAETSPPRLRSEGEVRTEIRLGTILRVETRNGWILDLRIHNTGKEIGVGSVIFDLSVKEFPPEIVVYKTGR